MADPRNADLNIRVYEYLRDFPHRDERMEEYVVCRNWLRNVLQWEIAEAERRGAAKEREACAEIAADVAQKHWIDFKRGEHRGDSHYQGMSDGAYDAAEAIRARADKENPQ